MTRLEPRRRRRKLRLGTLATLLGLPVLLWSWVQLAPLDPPEARLTTPGTAVLDAQGAVLYRDVEAGLRIPVALEQVAPLLREATVAAEDRRFFRHPGVDPLAIARAVLRWRKAPSGASTITQQLARRLYLDDYTGPTLLRKLREAFLALQIETRRSKEEILALYLNAIYYGRGAYGVEAAAQVYFGASARHLDLAQAAMLAGLPQLPGSYDPAGNLDAAQRRQAYVLDRLVAAGHVSRLEAQEAGAEPLEFAPAAAPTLAPHFVAQVFTELEELQPDFAGQSGLVIETNLDAGLQREAERLVRARLEEIRDRGAGNAAVVALDPTTGHILALVGSADFFDAGNAGQINMALQPRQPGSALKPFLYAAAFERGYTAATPLLDIPTAFPTAAGPYAPGNFDRRFHGVIPLRVALASSYNVPAVRTLDELGIDALLEMAHRVGLHTLTEAETYGLALTLGGGAVRLLDLTAAYGAIATGGTLVEPVAIARVRDAMGRIVYEASPVQGRRVLAAEHAYLLADILSDPAARTPGFGEVNPFTLAVRAGVKTGTTSGSRDNWTVGFTPDRVVGVWVGNTDNRPMENVSGVDGAGPIWRDVMGVALRGVTPRWLARPPGIEERLVCTPTGLLPGPGCPAPARELFVAGSAPTHDEAYYQQETDGGLLVQPPTEARAWAQDAGLTLSTTSPGAGERAWPLGTGAMGNEKGRRPTGPHPTPSAGSGQALSQRERAFSDQSVYIAQPVDGSVLFLSPELPQQELLLRASVPAGTTEVEFRVDGVQVGRVVGSDPRLAWRLDPGAHRLEVVARLADGSTATGRSAYEVRTR